MNEGVNFVTLGHHRLIEPERRRRCVDVRVCVHAGASVCASACVRDVFAIYDNNISHRLIMIIIN